MLDKVIQGAQGWTVFASLMENIGTVQDYKEIVGELTDYFVGDSDFEEELFDLIRKWTEKYVEEN